MLNRNYKIQKKVMNNFNHQFEQSFQLNDQSKILYHQILNQFLNHNVLMLQINFVFHFNLLQNISLYYF